jgi:hypothetical protein
LQGVTFQSDTVIIGRDDYEPSVILTAPSYVRSTSTLTLDPEQVTRRSLFLDADDPMSDDLRKWQSVTLKRWKSGQLEQALAFESAMIPPLLNAAIKGALQSCTSVDQIYTVFDDADRYRLHDAGTH